MEKKHTKKKLVVLTGAGISAESGIPTFRAADGLWEGYRVEEVATPEAWHKNPEMVLEFYNQRRRAVRAAQPNQAHRILKELEDYFEVWVITQNIDDLHERAGSSHILHLHGEILKSRSVVAPYPTYPIEGDLKMGDLCEFGKQLRPDVVWFGEMVPMMELAINHVLEADIFVVVGTSLVVYPAASLLEYVPDAAPVFLVDPSRPQVWRSGVVFIEEKATTGLQKLKGILLSSYL